MIFSISGYMPSVKDLLINWVSGLAIIFIIDLYIELGMDWRLQGLFSNALTTVVISYSYVGSMTMELMLDGTEDNGLILTGGIESETFFPTVTK